MSAEPEVLLTPVDYTGIRRDSKETGRPSRIWKAQFTGGASAQVLAEGYGVTPDAAVVSLYENYRNIRAAEML